MYKINILTNFKAIFFNLRTNKSIYRSWRYRRLNDYRASLWCNFLNIFYSFYNKFGINLFRKFIIRCWY